MIKKILIFLLVFPVQSFALDPSLDYEKISTEHFDIIFDAKSYDLAKKYLEQAQRSHNVLTKIFGVAPEKTIFLMDNSTDSANGAATIFPRPTVYGFVNPPTPLATIDHYSDWPQDLLLHEYTHILNMYPSRGTFGVLRSIFGSFFSPNMFLPRWYQEGLAVEMESRFNLNGRLKSTDYDSMIRSLYLDKKWGKETVSEINEVSNPYWPQGQRPYFYGALVWHEIVEKKGLGAVDRLNTRYAGRMPWFIGAPIEDEMGKSYAEILGDIYKKYGEAAKEQILKIKQTSITEGRKLETNESVFNHSPTLSPDGTKLAFVSQNLDGDHLIYIFQKTKKNSGWENLGAIPGVEKKDIQRVSWFPNSQKIIFDAAAEYDFFNFYFDLYTYDLVTLKTKRISTGLRGREPAVSPDGSKILFIKSNHAQTEIFSCDVECKNPRKVYSPPNSVRVSRPSFIDVDEIVFAQKNSAGNDQLHIYNIRDQKTVRTLSEVKNTKFPIVMKKGIVFTSNESGVENLYYTPFDFKRVQPLTNTLTRVINGTASENEIIFSEMTGDGPKIKTAKPEKFKDLPQIKHMIANDFTEKIPAAPNEVTHQKSSYSPISYLFPQYWMPFVYGEDGGVVATIYIPGNDALDFHNYLLAGEYDSRSEEVSGLFSYIWTTGIGYTQLELGDTHTYYSSFDDTTNTKLASLSQSFLISGWDKWKPSLGYEYQNIGIIEGTPERENKYEFHGPTVGISYSDLNQKNLDISPAGKSMSISYTHYLENNADTQFDATTAKLEYFHKKWLPARHVLALSMRGYASEDNNRNILLGTATNSSEAVFSPASPNFILRGYPSGEFIGYTMALGTLEYRFPLSYIYSGPNSNVPIFYKKLHGSLFAEGVTVDGGYFDVNDTLRATKLGKYYFASGLELKLDTTTFYHVPLTYKVTLAYGFEDQAQGGFTFNFAIGAPQLF